MQTESSAADEIRDRLASTFVVPPSLLGPPPPMEAAHERGVYLRAQCKYMGLDFDQWPAEAQEVEMAEFRARVERESRPFVYSAPPTVWQRIREAFGR